MANNINQQGQINPYPYTYGAQNQIPAYGAQPQPQPMVQQYFIPQNPPANYTPQPGITIVPVNSDDQIVNYPVASGNTVGFVNFNTNRMCFKSANINGVPMTYRWATIVFDDQDNQAQQQSQNIQAATNATQQNQNDVNPVETVSRQEFDELKAMLAEALSSNQPVNNDHRQNTQNQRYNGKRGNRNDDTRAVPANNV